MRPRGDHAAGPAGWLRFTPGNGGSAWTPCAPEAAFPAHDGWTGFVLATPPAIGALLRSLAAVPERPGGPIILQVNQPLCYSRALAEAATRHWNRLVLEFAENEELRAGQWRMLPGRALLAPGRASGATPRWHRTTNRICDPASFVRRQITLFGGSTESLRIFLFETPGADATAMLQSLADRGHAVFAHTERPSFGASPAAQPAALLELAGQVGSARPLGLGTNPRRTR
jgi:hypothetical protein